MQDRFKFRIFDTDTKVMHYDDFIITSTGFSAKIIEEFMGQCVINQTDLSTDNNVIVMQCTGLTDKNGKLIYEGDIVKNTSYYAGEEYLRIGLIIWDRTKWQVGLFKFQLPKAQDNRRPDRMYDFSRLVSFESDTPIKYFVNAEIIGNIYENKELLNDKN